MTPAAHGLGLVRTLVVATRQRASAERMSRHETLLLRLVVVVSLFACRRSEKTRRRVDESTVDRALALTMLAVAHVLSVVCRAVVGDRARFAASLAAVRGDVLRDTLRIELPLVVLSVLWDTSRATVVHTTCDNIHYLYLLSGTHVRFLVTAAWMKYRVFFVWHRAMCLLAEPFRGRDRVVWLANSPAELRNGERERCASVFVNHNCFINERRFPLLTPAARPRFDAVINANAGVWKRHYLARDVPSLAYITYSKDENGGMKWPVDTFEPAWRNERYLDENERLEIYGDSCCGLTLSACEGANYATTEYLLCGLPVVSSHSLGGRDVWLTPSNSTICDPTYEAVAGAVATWRRRHDDGATDHAAIREHCVQQMLEHRDRFVTTLQRVFDDAGIRATARDIFTGLQESDQMFHALTFQRNPGAGGHPHCNGKGWHSLWELPPGMRSR